MPDFDRLSGDIEWIDLSFVERQRTPDWAIHVAFSHVRSHFGHHDPFDLFINVE